jgi:hypothetical protein
MHWLLSETVKEAAGDRNRLRALKNAKQTMEKDEQDSGGAE